MKAACAILLLLSPAPVLAQDLPETLVRAELLGGWRTEAGTRMTALRLTMEPGWHTYWRSPGEAGIPPQFDWTGSENVAGAAYHWPVPQVFELGGQRTLGFEDELILPIEITPSTPDAPVSLRATIDIGVCDEICVPATVTVAGLLPEVTDRDARITAALSDQPLTAAEAGVASARCTADAIRDGLRLTTEVTVPSIGDNEFGVIELADRAIWVSEPTANRNDGTITLVSDLVPPEARPFALDRSKVRITLFGPDHAVDIRGCTG